MRPCHHEIAVIATHSAADAGDEVLQHRRRGSDIDCTSVDVQHGIEITEFGMVRCSGVGVGISGTGGSV